MVKDLLWIQHQGADIVLRIWNKEEGEQVETKWSKDSENEINSDGVLLIRKARSGARIKKFHFNFSDTRKMEFNLDKKLAIYGTAIINGELKS